MRGLLNPLKAAARRVLRIPALRRIVIRLALVAGAPPPLTSDEKPIMGEAVSAEIRLQEVEAERDALAEELAALRMRLEAIESRPTPIDRPCP